MGEGGAGADPGGGPRGHVPRPQIIVPPYRPGGGGGGVYSDHSYTESKRSILLLKNK